MPYSNQSIKEAVERLKVEAHEVWGMLIDREGVDIIDAPIDLIADICNDVRDLRNSLDHSNIRRRDCCGFNGVMHAYGDSTYVDSATGLTFPTIVCGARLAIDTGFTSMRAVPTCPDCIALLERPVKR